MANKAKAPAPAAPAPAAPAAPTLAAPAAPQFKLDTGLAIPPRAVSSGSAGSNYPFAQMDVGMSFLVPVDKPKLKTNDETEKAFSEACKTVSNRMSGAIRRFKKHNTGYAFQQRRVDDATLGTGIRVWRIAAEA